ncbi:uncharacterized protein K452DRAFT_15476 [Aplosporella prunicola CBS 121167]|uniref:Uncharacterized protein n=1 Tax=Aplosporella prunicola CBS 121167 TaxID=1176127 RepID=A0A6A6BG18_9PEZI|nr:uncharacterized protein K452DRAFT_15476 [Aplosporella prunicola CBS 121167]KAF2143092.1 hypothetical protein K452DRAFT_15476 [Aplosporella prunicola CBS 121167]
MHTESLPEGVWEKSPSEGEKALEAASTSDSDDSCAWYDDVEYNSDATSSTASTPIPQSGSEGKESSLGNANSITLVGNGRCIISSYEEPTAIDLDWAVIEFELSTNNPEGSARPFYFPANIKSASTEACIPAVMISGVRGMRHGFLRDIQAKISDGSDSGLCHAWNFTPSDSKGVVAGESGAVIIDLDIPALYGHVIGSNPIGDVYVVPALDTIEQVKASLQDKSIEIAALAVLQPQDVSGTVWEPMNLPTIKCGSMEDNQQVEEETENSIKEHGVDGNNNNPQAQSWWNMPTTFTSAVAKFRQIDRQNRENDEEVETDESRDYQSGMKRKRPSWVQPQPRPCPVVTSDVQGSYDTSSNYASTPSSRRDDDSAPPSYHRSSSRPLTDLMDSSTIEPYYSHQFVAPWIVVPYGLGQGDPRPQIAFGGGHKCTSSPIYSPPPEATQQSPPPPPPPA